MANSIILSNYNCYREKIILYKVEIEYGSLKWRSITFHQKIYLKKKIYKNVLDYHIIMLYKHTS